jgi:hypothetical protein
MGLRPQLEAAGAGAAASTRSSTPSVQHRQRGVERRHGRLPLRFLAVGGNRLLRRLHRSQATTQQQQQLRALMISAAASMLLLFPVSTTPCLHAAPPPPTTHTRASTATGPQQPAPAS